MILTTKMKYLISVVLDRDVDAMSRSLMDSGVLHFVNVSQLTDTRDSLKIVESTDVTVLAETRKKIEKLLRAANIDPYTSANLDVATMVNVNWEQVHREVDRLYDTYENKTELLKNTEQEILRLQDIRRQLELFGGLKPALNARGKYSFLKIRTGSVPAGNAVLLKSQTAPYPCVVLEAGSDSVRTNFVLMNMKKDDADIIRILDTVSWAETDLSAENLDASGNLSESILAKIESHNNEKNNVINSVQQHIVENRDVLLENWANLHMNEVFSRMQKTFSRTDRTFVVAGWIPVQFEKKISALISRTTEGRCYVYWGQVKELAAKDAAKVPVHLDNPRFLAPFEMLVKNYGTPEYGTVDPTIFVAVSYVAMFGLMFGDAGQGLVILILSVLGSVFGKKLDDGFRKLLQLGIYCGSAAIVAGIAFGSYFGWRLFPALWFDYHGVASGHASGLFSSVLDILVLTVYIGVGVIALGILLNWITLIRKRRYFKLIFDKTGLLGGSMYALGFYAIYSYAISGFKSLPSWTVTVLLVLTAFLLVKPLKETIEHSKHSGKGFSVMLVFQLLLEWFVEILEVVTGYLSNTLSFMRVAGLGIAHVFLMVAFFQMADMLVGVPVLYWLMIVVGNVVVIALEGLSAGIQALRLNYYEFFSKYFSGNGLAYNPVSLKIKK